MRVMVRRLVAGMPMIRSMRNRGLTGGNGLAGVSELVLVEGVKAQWNNNLTI